MKEHCLTTLIDQHVNVTEHDYLARERLHVDLRNFTICRVKADKPASESVSKAPRVPMSTSVRVQGGRHFPSQPRNIHRLSFMTAWLSVLKL